MQIVHKVLRKGECIAICHSADVAAAFVDGMVAFRCQFTNDPNIPPQVRAEYDVEAAPVLTIVP